ncbi:MAG TPA: hypothetical protein VHW95_00045 [Steroidobacteraceae bacterium]|jgi:hypothetical protein|nr:hypothetical protein [Steroidobacteraceae bacterium]
MPARLYRTEIAGIVRVGIECDSEAELEDFLGSKGIVLLQAAVPQPQPEALSTERRGRPSRDEEIAAAIDALDDELDRCGSIKAQARAVREYLKNLQPDDDPPGLSTIEIYVSTYRKPRKKTA